MPTEAVPWPEGRHRRISIDSFGLAGANAHVIIEADPDTCRSAKINGSVGPVSPQRLLVFSAHTETSLQKMLTRFASFTASEFFQSIDLAYTLGARRHHYSLRSFCVTDGLSYQPGAAVRIPERRGLLFIFTGQGAQWSGMGRELIREFPSFKRDIQQMDQWLSKSTSPPSWTIEGNIDLPPMSDTPANTWPN